MSNPESVDPIYRDLLALSGKHKKIAEDAEKELLSIQEDLEKASVVGGERATIRNDYFKTKKTIDSAKQTAAYYELRAKSRKEYDQKAYERAFEKDEDWPNKEEYRLYKIRKAMKEGPKNWGEALQSRLPTKNEEMPEKKKEKGEKKKSSSN